MKTLEWIRFLETQKIQHGKILFRVAELANVARSSHHALNVELARLVEKGILARYATGVYGLPGIATPEQLVSVLDSDAYITGMFALYRHNLITQVPTEITCFTNRRHNRSNVRHTPFGRLKFACVSRCIYARPTNGVMAPPEQALCDFAHIAIRHGLNPASLVTFRNMGMLNRKKLTRILKHYSAVAGEAIGQVARLRRRTLS